MDTFQENEVYINKTPKWKLFLRKHIPTLTIITLILLFIIVFFWPRIFITIGSGEAGVMFRRFGGGTILDKVYGEGFYIVPPWDKLTVYNMRVQTVSKSIIALTKDGLPIHIFYSIRFHPEYNTLGLLHKIVGPDYAKKVVFPECESTIRKIVGKFSTESIYTLKHSIVAPIVNKTIEKVVQRYVLIDNIMITKIQLPEKIENAIGEKIKYQIQSNAYDYIIAKERKEALRKKIEAEGQKQYNEIINSSIDNKILTWMGIKATLDLSKSKNSKIIIIGNGKNGLPVILNPDVKSK